MLEIHYTKAGLKTLKYVIVKMALKNGGYEASVRGLLLGYQSLMSTNTEQSKDEIFVWLYNSDCVYLYSLKYYNVRAIEVGLGKSGHTTEIRVYTEDNQKEAVKKIIAIKEALEDQSRMQENGLVDISTYKSLPNYINYKEKDETNTSATSTGGAGASASNPGITTASNSGRFNNNTHVPWASRKTETKFMKRTTRYSTTTALLRMGNKIEDIKNGVYKPPKLKKIAADTDDTKKKEDVKAKGESMGADEFFEQGYGGV